jgi:nucleoid DNA-binding protein
MEEKVVIGKNDFINILAEKSGKSKKETKDFYELFVDVLFEATVVKKQKVRIPDIGSINVKKVKGRKGVMKLKDRETPYQTEDSLKLGFRSSKVAEDTLNNR